MLDKSSTTELLPYPTPLYPSYLSPFTIPFPTQMPLSFAYQVFSANIFLSSQLSQI